MFMLFIAQHELVQKERICAEANMDAAKWVLLDIWKKKEKKKKMWYLR